MLYSTTEYKQAVPCIYENRFLASQFRQNILETNLNGQTVSITFLFESADGLKSDLVTMCLVLECFVGRNQIWNKWSEKKSEY